MRTLKESCKGLGSVSLKINNQHTHIVPGPPRSHGGGRPGPRAAPAAPVFKTEKVPIIFCHSLRLLALSFSLCLYPCIRAIYLEAYLWLLLSFLRILGLNLSPLAAAAKMEQVIFQVRDQNYISGVSKWVYGGRLFVVSARINKRHHQSSAIHFVCVYTPCLYTRYT